MSLALGRGDFGALGAQGGGALRAQAQVRRKRELTEEQRAEVRPTTCDRDRSSLFIILTAGRASGPHVALLLGVELVLE